MLLVQMQNINFRYENKPESIFDNLSLDIYDSCKVGLIGRNGVGKSTLVKLILEEITPNQGFVHKKDDLEVGYLPQEIRYDEEQLVSEYFWSINSKLDSVMCKLKDQSKLSQHELVELLGEYDDLQGYVFEIEIEKHITLFDLSESILNRNIGSLSGGEKTKIALIRILLSNPSMILLDEPTNHLDINTLQWLEVFLQNLKIPFLIISHDRKFLDNCVNEIWEIESKEINRYSGNYSFYRECKDQDFQSKMHNFESQKKKINKLKKALIKRKSWSFQHQGQTGTEGNAPVYESIGNESKSAMTRAKAIESRVIKDIEKAEAEKPWIEKKRRIIFSNSSLNCREILKVENLCKSFSNEIVLDSLSFSIKNHSRVSIEGPNGSGKSTLLKILMGRLKQSSGKLQWNPQVKIGYYSQEFDHLDENRTIIEEVLDGVESDLTYSELQSRARTILGCLNLRKDKVYYKISELSIGEKSKVALTKLILSDSNVLILDEPDNHLEIVAREALEDALFNYSGTILFVSHDRYFVEKIGTESVELD